MAKDWSHGEVLKAVFPLLDGRDLASCMLVCRHWRDIAGDDYFWKCVCTKRWPSICKRSLPILSYYKLFLTLSRPQPQPLLPPRLSFNDLEFYIDLWSEQELIFSEAISSSVLRTGIKNPPLGIPDILKTHLDGPDYKMVLQVEPRLTITFGSRISVSLLVGRKDTNQIACILRDSVFDYVDGCAFRALAYAYLNFSPGHPFISGIRAWVSLLFMNNGGNDNAFDVFGIEIDFVDAASKEHENIYAARDTGLTCTLLSSLTTVVRRDWCCLLSKAHHPQSFRTLPSDLAWQFLKAPPL